MAHRSHLVQVIETLSSTTDIEMQQDPSCGVEMKRKDFKQVLFRPGKTMYFCSKDCLNAYIHPSKEKRSAA
jgi:YHS domain-containing protein